jgi:hypothetical protein
MDRAVAEHELLCAIVFSVADLRLWSAGLTNEKGPAVHDAGPRN